MSNICQVRRRRHHGGFVPKDTRTDDEVLAALSATLEERLADTSRGITRPFCLRFETSPPG